MSGSRTDFFSSSGAGTGSATGAGTGAATGAAMADRLRRERQVRKMEERMLGGCGVVYVGGVGGVGGD
jgi:hypothetical protein